MDLKEVLTFGRQKLKSDGIDEYGMISEILVEHVFNIPKSKLIINYDIEVSDSKFEELKKYIENVIAGTPVQYITNKQEFMKLSFYVDENVLIPQPDTEVLVEEVLNCYRDKQCKILDLCTGSGAIGISLAKYIENSKVFASDISSKALQISKLNAEKNMVHKKMQFVESDMFEQIYENDFDCIVSNPPYIRTDVINTLDRQVQSEPHIALDGGDDGLTFYRIIAENAYKYIKDEGKLFLEIGYDQKDEVIDLLQRSDKYCNIFCIKDYSGNDRAIVSTVRR